ncbi:MAG: hypothetical protein NTX81_01900 [Candidatus Bathyarchaeota archaeon]|jgi:metal-responsive CopG/Arc/MetJ family transcriptional regulator|nr:hypothetical protein [Candidatus Bathyarchaeota archaeon]
MKETKMRRAFVTLPNSIWNILDVEMKGKIGDGDAEILRNMVIAYLSDQGYFHKKEEIIGVPSSEKGVS